MGRRIFLKPEKESCAKMICLKIDRKKIRETLSTLIVAFGILSTLCTAKIFVKSLFFRNSACWSKEETICVIFHIL